MNREKFVKLIENNNINFTPAQERFVDNVREGWWYTILNPDYRNGGQYMWVDNWGNTQHGGRLWTLMGNVSSKVKKETGVETKFHEWLKR